MSSIVTEQGILHYESIGRGRPVILLHGWINSWDVWRDVMISLAREGQHRVYALDFWGFGDSAKAANAAAATFQPFIIGFMADALGTAVAGFATAMVLLGLRAPSDEKQRSKYCKQTLHMKKSNRYKEFLS